MSRFYRKPIATLPPPHRTFRRRRARSRVFWWVLLGLVVFLFGWWMLSSATDVPKVEKLPDGTIVEVTEDLPAQKAEEAPRPSVTFAAKRVSATGAGASAIPAEKQAAETAPTAEHDFRPRLPRDVFEAQVALTRDAICPGSIDGAWGGQTQAAVVAFQRKHGLRVTGQLDNNTRTRLELQSPPLATYTITPEDLVDLRPAAKTWTQRAALDRLGFSSILEMVAERHWSNPKLIRKLNPSINWDKIVLGTDLVVPAVFRRAPSTRPDRIVIHLTEKTLELFDAESHLLAHFPCSIARRVDKRPVGDLEVAIAAPDPNYTFNPETFPDAPEARDVGRKLVVQPGPNNPVGVAWIGLSLPGYGIHGTPEPEHVGRTESSGCFRLANWNARYLLSLVYPGMPVNVLE